LIAVATAAVLVGVATLAARATSAPRPAVAAPAAPLFGINMTLDKSGHDVLVDDSATQQVFRGWGIPLIRVPLRPGLSDATYVKAMQAVKAVGATPMIIIRGPQPDSLTENRRLLPLVTSVFGQGTVYLEYGNEEDLGGMGGAEYTRYWNQVVAELKTQVPASYRWVGPANFQYDPAYAAQFARDANPKPDYLSWHEYVCGAGNDDAYCTGHIANWARHVTEVNDAVRAATGRTFPFFISEWNLDPKDESRYQNAAFIKAWTARAIEQLRALGPDLAGAMVYTATNHGDFGLLDGGRVTPQGEAFRDAAMASRKLTPSPSDSPSPVNSLSPSSSQSPSAPPSGGPSALAGRPPVLPRQVDQPTRTSQQASGSSGSSGSTGSGKAAAAQSPKAPVTKASAPATGSGAVGLSFESGSDGFGEYWGYDKLTVARTTASHYDGSYSLSIKATASGYVAAGTKKNVSGLKPGQKVTFHVWFGGTGAGTVQPWVMDTGSGVHFPVSERGLSSGWTSVTMIVPQVSAMAVGIELYNSTGGTAEIRIDAVSW
jgi:hypothetical protein